MMRRIESAFLRQVTCFPSPVHHKTERDVLVALDRSAGNGLSAKCTCPAGQSGYCNHVMALLFKIADYSLNQLECVPEDISCTSRLRQWGVSGESSNKAPVM